MPTPVLLAVDDDPAVRGALERDLRKHYDDDQIAALVFLVAMINATTGCW